MMKLFLRYHWIKQKMYNRKTPDFGIMIMLPKSGVFVKGVSFFTEYFKEVSSLFS